MGLLLKLFSHDLVIISDKSARNQQGPVAKPFKLATCSLRLLRIGRKSWLHSTFATRKRLVAASLRMRNLILHTDNSDPSNQSRCNLDASVNDA